jgi:hypothetical protein
VKGDGDGGGGNKRDHNPWCKKRGLYPGSAGCKAKETKIKNIEKDIQKRIGELHEDEGGLPWDKPGGALYETRKGHVRIINELKALLAEHKGIFVACCGGVW